MYIQNYSEYSKRKINVIQQTNHTHIQCEQYVVHDTLTRCQSLKNC